MNKRLRFFSRVACILVWSCLGKQSCSRLLSRVAAMVSATLLLSSCAPTIHSIEYTPQANHGAPSKNNLTAVVFDFEDLTNGANGKGWNAGWSFDNLSPVVADAAANGLRESGYFKKVERIHEKYLPGLKKNLPFDVVVAGEVQQFILGGNPHPTVYINPLSLFALIGLPTAYCFGDGSAEARYYMIDQPSGRQLGVVPARIYYDPGVVWSSMFTQSSNFETGGQIAAKLLEEEFKKSLKMLMFSGLGDDLLAREPRPHASDDYQRKTKDAPSDSDVEQLPAFQSKINPDSFAVVIGIEKYRNKLPDADFAVNDAKTVTRYLVNSLGFPEGNVMTLLNENATKSDIRKFFEKWLPNHARSGSTVFVYFSGLGAPNPKTGAPYLVPYDGDPSYIEETGYSLNALYDNLGKVGAQEVVVFFDTSFSGAGGKSVIAKGARPLVMSPAKSGRGPNGVTVMSASSGDQASLSYDAKQHGLFTYFLLKGIKVVGDSTDDGSVTIGDLFKFVKARVEREARKLHNADQSPLLVSPDKAGKQIYLYRN